MYKPFGEDVTQEMLHCIGYNDKIVCEGKQRGYFRIWQNQRTVRDGDKIWQTLVRCGYAEYLYTQINWAINTAYDTFSLTEKGIHWLGRKKKIKFILPNIVEQEYREEKVC